MEPTGWPDKDRSSDTRSLVEKGFVGTGSARSTCWSPLSRPPCVHAESVGSHRRLPPQTKPGIADEVPSVMPMVCAVARPSPAARAGPDGSHASADSSADAASRRPMSMPATGN
eukprot:scaffold5543_cov119-Isochrysis_galbana.AAC.6